MNNRKELLVTDLCYEIDRLNNLLDKRELELSELKVKYDKFVKETYDFHQQNSINLLKLALGNKV